jgi:protein TonB
MWVSRPTFTAAIFSCCAHICALGWSAALMLTQGEPLLVPLKVTILQPAVPLPVGEKEARGAHEPEPAAQPTPPPTKPEPQVKKAPEKPRRPATLSMKKPPPKVVTAPMPPEPVSQPAAFTLPADLTSVIDGAKQDNPEPESGTTVADAGTALGKRGVGSRNETGHGGSPGGMSARPDYGVNPKPPYPLIARRMGTQGVVLLRVHVRADGSVAQAEIKHSSGSALLDDSALRTVQASWRFMPARLDGVPVESWVEVPIRFVLGDA